MGGIPEDLSFPNINVTSNYATAPLKDFKRGSFYQITVDSLKYSSASSSKMDDGSKSFYVDSGSSVNYFPDDTAAAIKALFDPPAEKNEEGSWIVCPPATVN